jgi:hypothetical protein
VATKIDFCGFEVPEYIRKFRNKVFHFENLQSWNFEMMKSLIDSFVYGVGGAAVEEMFSK